MKTGNITKAEEISFSLSHSNHTPFSKDELAAILKFGAEDLFKQEDEDEEEPQVDIDEILKFAETHETEATTSSDELLSQFKVISFDNLEEDTDVNMEDSPEGGKEWEEIIPEHLRDKVEEEERQQQLLELHLPPRSRKTIKQLQLEYDSDREKQSKRKKDHDDSDASNEEDDDEDDDRPKKRGRPKANMKEKLRGFTDSELRRFIKSYKKFAQPLTRLDAIAIDAELQEKSEADLKQLAELLQKSVDDSMAEYNQKLQADPAFDGKKTHRGPTFKLSSVMVNAQAITKAQADLEPLLRVMPADREQRKKYLLSCFLKRVHWGCEWDLHDDSNLMKGIYEYGMGSWEAIKMDSELKLHDKILPDVDQKKPQAKHLQTRVEYVLRILRKQAEMANMPKSTAKGGKGKRKPKSRAEVIENDNSSGSEDLHIKEETNDSISMDVPRPKKSTDTDKKDESEISDLEIDEEAEGKKKGKKSKAKPKKEKKEKKNEKGEGAKAEDGKKDETKKKGKKKQKAEGPMHFTASSEPISIATEENALTFETDPELFKKCKDMMRPMKKSLRSLDTAREGPPDDKTVLTRLRQCMLDIGDHINKLLSDMSDPEQIKTWRTNLWKFVSNFADLDHEKLRKLYKRTASKRQSEDKAELNQSDSQHSRDSNTQSRKRTAEKRESSAHNHQAKKAREGKTAKKPKGSSSSSNSKSNGPKAAAGGQGTHRPPHPHKEGGRGDHGPSQSMHRPPPPKDGLGRPDHGPPNTTTSPTDRWQHTSPLARVEDIPRKRYNNFDRFGGGGPGSNHPGGNMGEGGGGGRGHYNHHHGDMHHNRRDHYGSGGNRGGKRDGGYRQDHNRDHHHSEYRDHYRDQHPHAPPPPHFSRHNEGGWGQGGQYPSYGDNRKRRPNEDSYGDRGHWRPHGKDPRLDPHSKDPRLDLHNNPRLDQHHKDPRLEHKEHCGGGPRMDQGDPRMDMKWHMGQPPPAGDSYMKH